MPKAALKPVSRLRLPAKGYRLWIGGPVPKQADAITLGSTIIMRKGVVGTSGFDELLRHEIVHVEQWRKLGITRFIARYIAEYLNGRRSGMAHHDAYRSISLEQEARSRAAAQLTHYQPQSKGTHVSTIQIVANSHRTAENLVATLTNEIARTPSQLPGWTVGHVVAHLALNAEALTQLCTSSANDKPAYMYESAEAREVDIERLSSADASELVSRLRSANAGFETAWSALISLPTYTPDTHTGSRVPNGPSFTLDDLPMRRLREVEVHSSDMGLRTYTYENWSEDYVQSDLPIQLADATTRITSPIHLLDERGTHHFIGQAAQQPAVHATRRAILAWLISRPSFGDFPTINAWQR